MGGLGFPDEQQLAIWNGKFSGARALLSAQSRAGRRLGDAERVAAILVWSALPGASRHHWSDCDVIDRRSAGTHVDCSAPTTGGIHMRLSSWLGHAHHYQFFLPYDRDRGGVQPEPWRRFAPVADLRSRP
jgi:LAS superfamily LD-carboxypeptidase LdcB